MKKEIMLEVIYKKVARKDFSFGCKVNYFYDSFQWEEEETLVFLYEVWDSRFFINLDAINKKINFNYCIVEHLLSQVDDDSYEIIWHSVMKWDVLDWIEKEEKRVLEEEHNPEYDWGCRERQKVLVLWRENRKPIENQSIECIEYIYDLIK